MSDRAKFDGLASDYDRYRPRYPSELAEVVFTNRTEAVRVADVGAGSGIALEWALPALVDPEVLAVEPSTDMIESGRLKFPDVTWLQGRGEDILPTLSALDVVMAAQAYQWFDRPAFLRAARTALRPGGRVAIIQNNRNHTSSEFLDAYESLLEENSPGYTRGYRDIDIAAELATGFDTDPAHVTVSVSDWDRTMSVDDFVGMSASSTQAQRAVSAKGERFLDDVRSLAGNFAEDETLQVPYRTELFVVDKP